MLVSDMDGTLSPEDPFKTHRVLKPQSESRLNFSPTTAPNKMKIDMKGQVSRKKPNYKWSTLEKHHRGNPKNRFEVKKAGLLTSDSKPLFSTFSKTGFLASAKEVNYEEMNKVNLQKLFVKVFNQKKKEEARRLKLEQKQKDIFVATQQATENSNKAQRGEDGSHPPVIFKNTLKKGIRTSGFQKP